MSSHVVCSILDSCLLSWNWGWEKCKKTPPLSLYYFFWATAMQPNTEFATRGWASHSTVRWPWPTNSFRRRLHRVNFSLFEGQPTQHHRRHNISSLRTLVWGAGGLGKWKKWGLWWRKRAGRRTSIRFLGGWFYHVVVRMMFLLLFYCLWKMMKNSAARENKHVGARCWLGAVIA